MNFGLFSMPTNPPERSISACVEQSLDVIEQADRLGYSEVWIGEHLTVPWEPLPACDLVIAQALARTERIKVCSGAYLLSFYHPAHLACRIMQLDHMAQGRFMCGVAAGFSPTDLRFIDAEAPKNHRMMTESLEMMKRIWTDHVGSSWEEVGEYWTVRNPEPIGAHGPHLRPFQDPHPPIALAGMTPKSGTIAYAGRHGYIPISLIENVELLGEHWELYAEEAEQAGLTPDREDWRVVRQGFVADTDEEARDWIRNSYLARYFTTAVLPGLRKSPLIDGFKHDPDVPNEAIDLEYLMEHWWLVGSPDTVAERLGAMYDAVGGFGTVVLCKYDYGETRDAYLRNLELFANEVIPAFESTHGSAAVA
jgi:alkanesulfonate monooxygenase SsuD/methylene tetrahydromethanopterin reductase-like flavin-dependent oxidoreductase (luciferase family)